MKSLAEKQMRIEIHPRQNEALKVIRETPVVLYGGARGGGKSYLVRAWMVMRRIKYPGSRGVIIRKTFPELQSNHIDRIFLEYPQLSRLYNRADKVIEFPNGSRLYFKHLQNPGDVYNFQGLEFDDIALDEAGQHTEMTFSILRASNRTTRSDLKPRFLLTGNPGGIGHGWLKRLFIERRFTELERPSDYAFVPSKVYDNPSIMENDPDYVHRLESLPDEQRRAYLDGDWNVFVGQFFTEFRKEKHVIDPRFDLKTAPVTWDYVLSWDEGTLRPRAVYVIAQDRDGKVEIIWEYYRTGETAVEAAQIITSALMQEGILEILRKNGKFVYDPSMDIASNQTGLSTSKIVNSYLQMRMEPANNDRIEGARLYREYLHWDKLTDPLLRIWSTCPNLIEEIPALVYAEGRRGEDVNSESADHGFDSTRYGIMALRRPAQRLKRPRAGDPWEDEPLFLQKLRGTKKKKILNPMAGY